MSAQQVGIPARGGQVPMRHPAVWLGRLDADPRIGAWLPAIALTLLDAALTYAWLTAGLASEGNPWLAGLVATWGPAVAMAVRLAIGTVLVGILAVLARHHPAARRGLVLVTGVLGLVVGWHVTGGALVAFA